MAENDTITVLRTVLRTEVIKYPHKFDQVAYSTRLDEIIAEYSGTTKQFVLVHDIREINRFDYLLNIYALIFGANGVGANGVGANGVGANGVGAKGFVQELGPNFEYVNVLITREQGSINYIVYINSFFDYARWFMDINNLKIEIIYDDL
jgi:hypothetical protein